MVVVPTVDTVTLLMLEVMVPLASAKRPVPPVIVLTSVDSLPVAVNVPVPVAVVNTSSPFAATMIAVSVKLNVSGPVIVSDVMSLVKVNLPRWERWPLPTTVPVPVAVLMVVVDVLVPLDGRSVPFAAPSAAAGLRAATASTKLERKISLRSGILPLLSGSTPVLLARNGSWYRVGRNGAEAKRVGESIGLVGESGDRRYSPLTLTCCRLPVACNSSHPAGEAWRDRLHKFRL